MDQFKKGIKMKLDKQLFNLLESKTRKKWKKFSRYYLNDSKQFLNKISRDYESSGRFPIHIYKTIKNIDKSKYDSAVCVLRGALPYVIMFEALGWKVHYVICGRKNEKHGNLRLNKSVDRTLKRISGKKILIIENNVVTGDSPIIVAKDLKKSFQIKKPDLFVDYFVPKFDYLKHVIFFLDDKKKLNVFDKIYTATKVSRQKKFSSNVKISKKEESKLKEELLELLK